MKIFKRAFACMLAILLIVTSAPVTKLTAEAATDSYYSKYGVTYEQLFTLYPQYLYPEYEDVVLDEVFEEIKTVIDSYSTAENWIASYMYSLKNGIEILGTELLSKFGLTDNTKTKMTKDTIKLLMNNINGVSNPVLAAAENVGDRFKNIKLHYDILTSAGKAQYIVDMNAACKNISDAKLDKLLDGMFENTDKLMGMAGTGIEFCQLATGIIQMQEIEQELICVIMDALPDYSALKEALAMLLDDINKDIVAYVIEHYCTEKVIETVVDIIKEGINAGTGGKIFGGAFATSLAKLCITLAVDYLYTGAMADDIVQVILLNTYAQELSYAISSVKNNFILTPATTESINNFKILYNAYIQALKTATESASKLAKGKNQKYLMQSCITICNNYTYDSYINSCMIDVKAAIDAGKVKAPPKAQTSGSSKIEVTEEESRISIQEKFRQLQAAYPPNQGRTFTQSYGGAIQCFGFARFAFNKLFDCDMPAWYIGNKRYQYGNNQNVVMLGQLAGSAQVNETNVKNLLQQALVGDIIQACGSYSQHTMMVVGADDSGITVYECNWYGECGIYQRTISYASFAQSYGTPHAESECGVSLYRAANYDSLYWDGSAVFYDDSVNFVIQDGVLTKYNGWQAYVTIPEEVTAIGDNAFKNNDNIIRVTMTDNVTSIGKEAFYDCDNLYYCTTSANLESIGEQAFYSCGKLAGFEMPNTVTQLGDSVFRECTSLSTVSFSSELTGIPSYTFYECTSLSNFDIPYGIETINSYAFYRCESLTAIAIPDSVTTIGNYAFRQCVSLKDVTLSKSLTSLGDSAFRETAIESIEIPKSLEECTGSSWAYYNFNNTEYQIWGAPFFLCENLKNVTFENGTTKIANSLFRGCTGLEEIVIPNTVTVIENNAFEYCLRLRSVVIGNSVTTIEDYAFGSCVSLPNITIPNSVTTIGNDAFSNCVLLKNVTLSKSLTSLGYRAFRETAIESIEIPKSLEDCGSYGSSNNYEFNDVGYSVSAGPFFFCENLKSVTFENGITRIADNLFKGCVGLEEIIIPDTVTIIESGAFEDCLRLSSVKIGNSVTTIENYAFRQCVSLSGVAIPDSVTTIGNYAFSESGLVTVEIPDSITSVGTYTFANCTSLESVKLSENVDKVRQYMFNGCTSLKTITIPEKVETIENYAFRNNSALESIVFAENSNLKNINAYTFDGCSLLKEVILPEKTKEISNYAFRNCVSLEKVYIPQATKTLGTDAFIGCEKLSDVTIADYSITEIKANTFKDCPGLQKIVLPKGLTKIGSQAFMNDTGLIEVTIPESVTSIDSTAFSYPDKTTIFGRSGSYAETFANTNGFKFVNNAIPAEGLILADGSEYIVLDYGQSYRAEFEFYPEDSNDVVTLTANNSKVKIEGHDIKSNSSSGDSIITATASSGLTYEFTIHNRDAKRIEIISQPTKTDYIMGEELDLTGLKMQVLYNDNSVREITDYTVSGFDSSVEGECTVTIEWYAADGDKHTTTFKTNIIDTRPKLTGIYIASQPAKVNYELREALDLTGLVVKATYTDNSEVVLTESDFAVTGYNRLKKGTQTITVTYGDYTATFDINVGVECEHTSTEIRNATPVTCTEDGYTGDTYCLSCGIMVLQGNDITATGHDYVEVVTAPTCIEQGYTTYTCFCGDSYVDDYINATGHSFGEWTVTKAATCTATGVKIRECSGCDATETATIEMTAHTLVTVPGKAATCTETGLTDGEMCSICGDISKVQNEIPMTAHTVEILPAVSPTCSQTGLTEGKKCSVCDTVIVAQTEIDMIAHTEEILPAVTPTCTETGFTEGKKCSVCDTVIIEQTEISATGHTPETIPGKAPTETETGLTDGEKCSVCNTVTKEQTVIPELGHTHAYETVVTAPTCTQQGYTTYTCFCGDSYVDDYVNAPDHSFGEWTVTKAATCTATGVKTRECTACDATETATVEMTAHTLVTVPGKAATCTEKGLTDGKKCSVCNTVTVAQTEIAMTAHDLEHVAIASTCKVAGVEYDVCTECDEIFNNRTLALAAHTYGEWTVTTPATCTATGVKTRKCSVCGAEETAAVEKTAHNLVTVPGKAATCTETGLTDGKKCSVCNTVTVAQTEIAMTAHDLEHVAIASTCKVTGVEYDVCTECDEIFNIYNHSLAEHTYGEWIVTTAATCTTNGEKPRECSVCGEKETLVVEMTGHTLVTMPAKDATCTEAGLTEGEQCSACGEVSIAQTEIPATGHTFEDWEVTTEATYINEGVMTKECSVCGEKETKPIEKLEAVQETVDEESNIAIKHQDDTYNGEMKVEAKEEFDGESFQILNNEKGNFKNTLFDITTTVDGEKVQPNGYVLVGIPLPEGYNPEETVVYFVANDGSGLKKMNSYYADGFIWFETNHFSSYALVDESEEITAPEYILGDVNGDGKVNATDARLALRIASKLETPTEIQNLAADVNLDNKVNAADARTILRVASRLETL